MPETPYSWDPQAANPLRRIHDLVRDRLQVVMPAPQFTHDTVPARLTPSVWADLTRRRPFVGLGWTGIADKPESGRRLQSRAQFSVFLVASHPKPAERMLGDQLGPGLFGMVNVAILALHGMTIGGSDPASAAGTVAVTGASNAFIDGGQEDHSASAIVNLAVPVTFDAPLLVEPGDFLRLGLSWRFEGAANPALTEIHEVRAA